MARCSFVRSFVRPSPRESSRRSRFISRRRATARRSRRSTSCPRTPPRATRTAPGISRYTHVVVLRKYFRTFSKVRKYGSTSGSTSRSSRREDFRVGEILQQRVVPAPGRRLLRRGEVDRRRSELNGIAVCRDGLKAARGAREETHARGKRKSSRSGARRANAVVWGLARRMDAPSRRPRARA